MNAISFLSALPMNLAILVLVALLVTAGLVFYALYKKGDVRAMVSHGSTVFKLEAKERKADRK